MYFEFSKWREVDKGNWIILIGMLRNALAKEQIMYTVLLIS